jgi:Kef-type K+ transport system membrane component KefB
MLMDEYALPLLVLGGLFLAGLAADQLGQKTRLPRVTLLLLCGLAVGNAGFDLVPDSLSGQYELFSVIALTMVAFLLGGSLSMEKLRQHGIPILVISLSVVVITVAVVSFGLLALGVPMAAALALGAIATATAPAATFDVIRETGIKSGFTDTLKGIVAIDDAWGLIVFSLVMVFAPATASDATNGLLWSSAVEILGSVALGLAIGLPGAVLTGRLSDGEPLRIEALGLTFVTAGLALWLDLSFLIAGMTVGAVIVNLARHHTRAFHEIEDIQWPFMLIFFILAGATLEIEALGLIGGVGLAFVALRTLSRLAGGWVGAWLARAPKSERIWYGPALLPQAGVAIGMSLMASEFIPTHASLITAVTIGSTVVFELVGPLIAALAIRRTASQQG